MQSVQGNAIHSSLVKATTFFFAFAATGSFGISSASAQVVFDDGKMHVISDDTYALDRIEVRNHSKLKIVDGAVIAATIFPNYDYVNNDSGLPVLEFSDAAVQVFDKSKVIVQGGVFGGEPFDPNPEPYSFLNNWYSGAIAAFDQSKVIIEDGTFGRGAFRSGAIAIFDDARLNVSGGTFTNPGGSGGRIELFGNARANISGGLHGSTIAPDGDSSLHISGGFFGKDDGFRRGAVLAFGFATVKISGGTFGGGGYLSGMVGVGEFLDPAPSNGDPLIVIEGGSFDAPGPLAGSLVVSKQGTIEVKGCEFNLPFGLVEPVSTNPFTGPATPLMGVLASGEVINTSLYKENSLDAILALVEEPCD